MAPTEPPPRRRRRRSISRVDARLSTLVIGPKRFARVTPGRDQRANRRGTAGAKLKHFGALHRTENDMAKTKKPAATKASMKQDSRVDEARRRQGGAGQGRQGRGAPQAQAWPTWSCPMGGPPRRQARRRGAGTGGRTAASGKRAGHDPHAGERGGHQADRARSARGPRADQDAPKEPGEVFLRRGRGLEGHPGPPPLRGQALPVVRVVRRARDRPRQDHVAAPRARRGALPEGRRARGRDGPRVRGHRRDRLDG